MNCPIFSSDTEGFSIMEEMLLKLPGTVGKALMFSILDRLSGISVLSIESLDVLPQDTLDVRHAGFLRDKLEA